MEYRLGRRQIVESYDAFARLMIQVQNLQPLVLFHEVVHQHGRSGSFGWHRLSLGLHQAAASCIVLACQRTYALVSYLDASVGVEGRVRAHGVVNDEAPRVALVGARPERRARRPERQRVQMQLI